MVSEEWEFDFNNPPRIPPPEDGCDKCRIKLPGEPIKVRWVVPGGMLEHFYCSEECKYQHRLQIIREAGL